MFILIYKINDYPNNGGGLYYDKVIDSDGLEQKVTALANQHGELFEIVFAAEIRNEIHFKKVEVVTKYTIDHEF